MSNPSERKPRADRPSWSDVGFVAFLFVFYPAVTLIALLRWAGVL